MVPRVLGDLRFAVRSARCRPLVLRAVVLTLTLGLGASAARSPVVRAASAAGLSFTAAERPRPQQSQALPEARLSANDRIALSEKIVADIRTWFSHWKAVPSLDFAKAAADYLAKARTVESRRDFDMATLELFGQLHNSHSGFYDSQLDTATGLDVRPLGQRWVVFKSRREGIRVGDEVLTVDGRPVEAFFQAQRRYLCTSSDRTDRVELFRRGYVFPPTFELGLGDGRQVRVTVGRAGLLPLKDVPPVEGRWLEEGRLAYLRVGSFSKREYETEAIAQVKRFQSAQALILDLRSNLGGNTPTRLAKALIGEGFRSQWVESTTLSTVMTGRPSFLQYLRTSLFVHPGVAFRGRILVLQDVATMSAAEDLMMPLKQAKRATFIGAASHGSTGQPHWHEFDNGMSFRVGAKRQLMLDGTRFEGVGIPVDVAVAPTVEDLREGRDPVLARAIAESRR